MSFAFAVPARKWVYYLLQHMLQYCDTHSLMVPRLKLRYFFPNDPGIPAIVLAMDHELKALLDRKLVPRFSIQFSSTPQFASITEQELRLLALPVLEMLTTERYVPKLPVPPPLNQQAGQPPETLRIFIDSTEYTYTVLPSANHQGGYADVVRLVNPADPTKVFVDKIQKIAAFENDAVWVNMVRGECRAYLYPKDVAAIPKAIFYQNGLLHVRHLVWPALRTHLLTDMLHSTLVIDVLRVVPKQLGQSDSTRPHGPHSGLCPTSPLQGMDEGVPECRQHIC
jgi:hypothetical protein